MSALGAMAGVAIIVATLIAFPGIGLAYSAVALVFLAIFVVGDRLRNPPSEPKE